MVLIVNMSSSAYKITLKEKNVYQFLVLKHISRVTFKQILFKLGSDLHNQ